MVSVHIGSRSNIEGYISDKAIINDTMSDEEKKKKQKSNDAEMQKFGGTEMMGALTIIESASKAQEEEVPDSYKYRYLEKLKEKEKGRINKLLLSEETHPKSRDAAEYIHSEYQKMTLKERRQRYASDNPDILHDADVSSEMTRESLKIK